MQNQNFVFEEEVSHVMQIKNYHVRMRQMVLSHKLLPTAVQVLNV